MFTIKENPKSLQKHNYVLEDFALSDRYMSGNEKSSKKKSSSPSFVGFAHVRRSEFIDKIGKDYLDSF